MIENNKIYIKDFDDEYSQFREAQILAYLNQRNAPVPKLILNDIEKKKITMQNTGNSLDDFIKIQKFEDNILLLIELIEICKYIVSLGIFNFDLALRNFTKIQSSKNKRTVFMIDFAVSISSSFPLHKPLWLKPDSLIHHPNLLMALEEDWENFYKFFGKDKPKFYDSNFSVSYKDYKNFWSKNFSVENLDCPFSVVCHNIGVVSLNLLDSISTNKSDVDKIKMEVQSLINLKSDDIATKRLEDFSLNILAITKNKNLSLLTPRPIFSAQESTKIKKHYFDFLIFNKNKVLLVLMIFSSFVFIDYLYTKNELQLSDIGFYFGVISISGLFFLGIILFFSIKNKYFFNLIKFHAILITFFSYELLQLGISIFYISIIFIPSVCLLFFLKNDL